ncbi:Cationic amino acid transporter 2 [Varanus komodoensis]|nr:Cationic amino acid transporter 2 [Varanus komodoensis]
MPLVMRRVGGPRSALPLSCSRQRAAGHCGGARSRPSGPAGSFSCQPRRRHGPVLVAVQEPEIRHDRKEGEHDGDHEEEGHHEKLHPATVVEEQGAGDGDDHHGEEGEDDAHAAHSPRLLPPALAGCSKHMKSRSCGNVVHGLYGIRFSLPNVPNGCKKAGIRSMYEHTKLPLDKHYLFYWKAYRNFPQDPFH